MSESLKQKSGIFEVESRTGAARSGEIEINGRTVKTPYLFPGISLYGGATKNAVFGGGLHRTLKEFMIGEYDRPEQDIHYRDIFSGVMASFSQFADFTLSEKYYNQLTEEKIRDHPTFNFYDGLIFIDSGGYKFYRKVMKSDDWGFKDLVNGDIYIDGSNDYKLEVTQERVFKAQMDMGADMVVNLDIPIQPGDTEKDKKERYTTDNAAELVELSEKWNYEGALYLTVHGYDVKTIKEFLQRTLEKLSVDQIDEAFDGIALGSLVPIKDNREKLITTISACKEAMEEYDISHLPLHVLGISSKSIPLLVALGADTFDSTTYFQQARSTRDQYVDCDNFGKYRDLGYYKDEKSNNYFSSNSDLLKECDCKACSDPNIQDDILGPTTYRKDRDGAVAIHNLIHQQQEVEEIRNRIARPEEEPLISYILGEFDTASGKKYAHRAINTGIKSHF